MDIDLLKQKARELAQNSYAPYSQFPVAAAFYDQNGNIYGGVNVENMSFGLTICAERNAIFSAATTGCRTIDAMVIYTPTPEPTMPCGACRQVIWEFSSDAKIIAICDSEKESVFSIRDLLPGAFVLETNTRNDTCSDNNANKE
ncbi:cytidine deaminase [Microbulbifer bruguierae]|uniref:Cytidine deaminase n=1 Tax=Microbulbifer bruguierae TaxID=3029061 RepID=A0ABY8NHL3_9GAMM|nr:cytidine deaminase [Microbulbifer bruguierae]WGL17192.1 cytidine deaminase [Microbulbifer bruguierae]